MAKPVKPSGVNHDRSHDRRYLPTVRTCSPTWSKLHGPLTVNELGLDYRIVIATVDDGRRWVLRIPRRAEVSAKVEPEARVLAMLKNRLPFAVPDWRVANAELVAYPMLEDSTAMVIQPGSSTPDWVVPQDSEVFAESFATALAALHAVPISAAVDADAHPYTDAGPSEGGRRR